MHLKSVGFAALSVTVGSLVNEDMKLLLKEDITFYQLHWFMCTGGLKLVSFPILPPPSPMGQCMLTSFYILPPPSKLEPYKFEWLIPLLSPVS